MPGQQDSPSASPSAVVFDSRGTYLESFELSFFAEARADQWQRFVDETCMHREEEEEASAARGTFHSVNFVALPADVQAHAFYLSGGAHQSPGAVGDLIKVHWHLEWERAPSGEPPPRMRERSDEVGGYPRFFEQLIEQWPTAERSFECALRGRYLVDKTRWRLAVEHTEGVERTFEIGSGTARRTVTRSPLITMLAVEPPSGPVSRVVVADEENVTTLSTFGKIQSLLSVRLREDLDAALWGGLEPLLRSVAGRGT